MAQTPGVAYGGRSSVLALAVILAAGVVAVWLYRPFVEYQRLSGEIGSLEAGIAQLERDNGALRDTVQELDTPRGMELKLRELGWVRTDERVVRTIPSYSRDAAAQVTPTAPSDWAGRVRAEVAQALRRLLVPGGPGVDRDRPA